MAVTVGGGCEWALGRFSGVLSPVRLLRARVGVQRALLVAVVLLGVVAMHGLAMACAPAAGHAMSMSQGPGVALDSGAGSGAGGGAPPVVSEAAEHVHGQEGARAGSGAADGLTSSPLAADEDQPHGLAMALCLALLLVAGGGFVLALLMARLARCKALVVPRLVGLSGGPWLRSQWRPPVSHLLLSVYRC